MARGWESKSVELQIDSAEDKAKARRKPLSLEEQASERKVDSLVLHRTRVLVDIAKARDERYRKTLEEGLAYLEAQLKELGWKPE